jgi:hypothetical protein
MFTKITRNLKMKENLDLKGGVLIIGSLLWQDHYNGEDNIRKLWRDKHLLLDRKIMVKVPIRYGRLSKSGIYTMTFSNSCKTARQGTGFFVPFKQTPLSTFKDLIGEVKETSIAEGMDGSFISTESGTKNIWCCMGIMTNPKTVGREKERELITEWGKEIKKQEALKSSDLKSSDFKIGNEKPCIDQNGKLNLNWLSPVDKRDSDILNSYDFVIATATKPTDYPNIKNLSEKVKADTTRYYFIQNYKFGITTFQDINVLNKVC